MMVLQAHTGVINTWFWVINIKSRSMKHSGHGKLKYVVSNFMKVASNRHVKHIPGLHSANSINKVIAWFCRHIQE